MLGKSDKEMRSEIRVRLTITDFKCSPNEITRILKIDPTKTWLRGDPIPKTIMMQKQHGWQLDSPKTPKGSVEQQTDALLRLLAKRSRVFKSLPSEAEVELSCIIYSHGGDRPPIAFNRATVRKLAQLNASIDIDFYVL